jgi:hypothetical protein
MPSFPAIIGVDRVIDAPIPPTTQLQAPGAKPAIPLLIEVQTVGGPAELEISQDAAVELRAALAQRLQARGFP